MTTIKKRARERAEDNELRMISAKMPEEFEAKMNTFLKEGGWRVAQTEMSITDHHYWAMLIKSGQAQPCLTQVDSEHHEYVISCLLDAATNGKWSKPGKLADMLAVIHEEREENQRRPITVEDVWPTNEEWRAEADKLAACGRPFLFPDWLRAHVARRLEEVQKR